MSVAQLIDATNDEEIISINPIEWIYTIHGRLNKAEVSRLCMDLLFTDVLLDFDVLTLVAIFEEFDKEDTRDEMVDATSGVTLYSARVQVLKTLVNYPDVDELTFYVIHNREKPVVKMILEAGDKEDEKELQHLISPKYFISAVPCKCRKAKAAKNVLSCVFCNAVVCDSCSKNPCVFTLQEVINSVGAKEENDEEEEEDDYGEEEMDFEDEEEDMDFDC